jgi:hypothetical protein
MPQADSKRCRQKSPPAATFARRRWRGVPAAAGGGGGANRGRSCAAGVQGGGGGQRRRQSFVDGEFRRHGFRGGGRAGDKRQIADGVVNKVTLVIALKQISK